ncbi:MAG: glycosyltransferase family 2 protein [Gammaproteobacteria bacterium]|nr:glycosyltransferase family 2 protein [Gammaproteobacteria bacterium]
MGPGLDGDLDGEDREIGIAKVLHEPTAACYTHVPDSFRKLARQRYRRDRSMVRFRMRKHRRHPAALGELPAAQLRIVGARNIFFNVLMNLKWWVYIFQIMLFHPTQLPVIFFINYVLYTLANVVEGGRGVSAVRALAAAGGGPHVPVRTPGAVVYRHLAPHGAHLRLCSWSSFTVSPTSTAGTSVEGGRADARERL